MDGKSVEIEAVLRRVADTYETAKFGLDDLLNAKSARRMSGLRNVLVFGRSVTFVLQNLRSVVGEHAFNAWYAPHQAVMQASPLMRYFVDARNALEKQGRISVSTSLTINSFSPAADMPKFGLPPPNATAFFMGDEFGGTGWIVAMPDGSTTKYYVDLPGSVGNIKQTFADFPAAKAPELADLSIEQMCTAYLGSLAEIIASARTSFGLPVAAGSR